MFNIYDNYNTLRKVNDFVYKSDSDCEEYKVNEIKFKLYRANSKKCIVYIHGGGFVIGSSDTYANLSSKLCSILNRNIIVIDYRLAPEYKYPCAINDCIDVLMNLYNHCDTYNIDLDDLVVMGDSAGANIAIAIAMKLRGSGYKISKEILLYPLVQTDISDSTKYRSLITNDKYFFLTRKMLKDYLKLYLSNKNEYKDVFVSPILSKNLFRMPDTFVITADFDILRDEGFAYYKKLKRFFNNSKYYNVNKSIHGFMTNPICYKECDEVIELIKSYLEG